MYIYQHPNWTDFKWNNEKLLPLLGNVQHLQGRLLGQMENLGFQLKEVEVTMAEYGEAWQKVYPALYEKGYECDSRDHYELYVSCAGDTQDANAPWIVDLCIPVK